MIDDKPSSGLSPFNVPGCSAVPENDIPFDVHRHGSVRRLVYYQPVYAVVVRNIVAQIHDAFVVLIARNVDTTAINDVGLIER